MVNVKNRKVLKSVAVVVEAGPGKEDRITSGSYVALRERERRENAPPSSATDSSYLPDFLKD
jgi:hypothetical protein